MTPGAEPDNLRTPVPPLAPSIPHADSAGSDSDANGMAELTVSAIVSDMQVSA